MSGDAQKRRDLNTMVDVMTYLRDLNGRATGSYTSACLPWKRLSG